MKRVMLISNKKGLVFTYFGARYHMSYDLRSRLDIITRGTNISDKAYYKMYCNLHKECYGEEWFFDNIDTVVNNYGKNIDYQLAVGLMDDVLRIEVDIKAAPCTSQKFFEEYCKRHFEEFGEEFGPNKEIPTYKQERE